MALRRCAPQNHGVEARTRLTSSAPRSCQAAPGLTPGVGPHRVMIVRRFLTWFFSRPSEPLSRLGIIAWWEIRRVPYNLIVGVIGAISLLLFFLFISLADELKPGEDAVEPMALLVAPIAANICYTGGWIVELLLSTLRRKGSPPAGPVLLKLGKSRGQVFSFDISVVPYRDTMPIWYGPSA